MIRIGLLALTMAAAAAPALALCTNEAASAKAQEFGRLFKEKMARDPDAASELGDQFGEIMTSGPVTEQTCARFDALIAKARRM